MAELKNSTLCILGCGNLGTALLKGILTTPENKSDAVPFSRYIACVKSKASEQRLAAQFSQYSEKLVISIGDNVSGVKEADVIILALDPSIIATALTQNGLRDALAKKLIISVAAGWTRQKIETTIYGDNGESASEATEDRAFVIRTLPNIAALVSQSLTAIEIEPGRNIPETYLHMMDAIFSRVGKTVHVPPNLMDATTAVAGSTPAMFSVIVDAMIDAAVAVGVPRDLAHVMIFQAMQGTATMLQSGIHPALLKDQGTSPEGCTIGGLMKMEEAGVRGHVGRALREAVTIARLMDGTRHVNDTRE
ncbi:pyrroline-5-carboxylate reductase dimerization-domain-containing protein [Talaromyces proteolyticus]|uniref:Pyrroline-5-carboxylate reductase dimerization-domain-containing protein n=1 Tax=Talaromyces proteolyticus TaxID=1131652 RepID=A0AAD4KSP9_9EURO|nr:pyrroline-5-carboxylate reductase dimerization-domain-containing protein [Talaromyces proteolyticus]KAH8700212.1 pyrroline-5-carboxylate reductase dimerization-domain-containing protein [Talaromyces proteolyticus]